MSLHQFTTHKPEERAESTYINLRHVCFNEFQQLLTALTLLISTFEVTIITSSPIVLTVLD